MLDKPLGGEKTERAAVAYTISQAHEALERGGDVETIAFALGEYLVSVRRLIDADRACGVASEAFYRAINAV
jgi:hypothetical protein